MPHGACADMFSTLTQVVDHSGSAEEGADLIYAQLEKVIKQVQTVSQQSQSFCNLKYCVCTVIYVQPFNFYPHYVGAAGS